jgi:hypothetical protein
VPPAAHIAPDCLTLNASTMPAGGGGGGGYDRRGGGSMGPPGGGMGPPQHRNMGGGMQGGPPGMGNMWPRGIPPGQAPGMGGQFGGYSHGMPGYGEGAAVLMVAVGRFPHDALSAPAACMSFLALGIMTAST